MAIAISPLYIPLFSIEEVILDKDTGLPLSGGVVDFFRDSQRTTPKMIYRISGTSPNYTFVQAGSQLTLGISGTFVDINGNPFVPYAFPYDADGNTDLYYITVKSQGLVSQFVREAVPYIGLVKVPTEQLVNTENELSNPQFVELLVPTVGVTTLSITGANTVTRIAPGWDLITSGSGTVELERLEPQAASVPTNPPYALKINASNGFGATIKLRQRLNNSPSIIRGGFASFTFTAAVIGGGNSAIGVSYAPSLGAATTIVPNTNVPTDGAYHTISGNAAIPDQPNSPASTGYVDILVTIPTSRNIAITSLQLVGLGYSANIPYDEQTVERQKDQLFHYYENSLVRQSKENLLAGWNFALNPWQINRPAPTTITAQTFYITDQTILYQETAGALSVGRAAYNLNYGLQLAAINGVPANRFAIIQYIDKTTIAPYWAQKMSCLVRGIYNYGAGALPAPQLKMRLIWRTDAIPVSGAVPPARPLPPALVSPITSFDTNGDPVFAAGWNQVKPLNDIAYTMETLASLTVSNLFPAMPFDEFQLPTPTGGSIPLYLGVVVYINKPLNDTAGNVDYVVFDRISMTNNDFALDCANETYEQSLEKCQYYYEKTYPENLYAGDGLAFNQVTNCVSTILVSGTQIILGELNSRYNTIKRTNTPITTFYSPVNGAPNSAYAFAAVSNFTFTAKRFFLSSKCTGVPVSTTAITTNEMVIVHWEADARLGIAT
jgi:hypothetical protein